jgi:hypothetical protein
MRRLMLKGLATIALTTSVLIGAPLPAIAQAEAQAQQRTMVRRPIPLAARNGALNFARTELFFGTAKPDGVVSDAEFFAFLDAEITPRFPDGLTLLKGDGQFRSDEGIIKEDSFVLILLYPVEDFRESSRRINTIRRLYREAFDQQSVLRVDDPFAVRVSF